MGRIFTSNFASWHKFNANKRLIVISQTRPAWFQMSCNDWSVVKPTIQLVLDYKSGQISHEDYTNKYMAQLYFAKDAIQHMVQWMQGLPQDSVLLCHCAKGKFCHRHLLAKYIKDNFDIDVQEL